MFNSIPKSITPNNQYRRKISGFTLIEILIVVAILGILAATSYPFYSRLILQNTVTNTTNNLVGTLRKAQIYAMTGKDGSNWGVQYSNSKITLVRISTNTTFDSFDVSSTLIMNGPSRVIFSRPAGLPDITTPYSISGGSDSESITLNAEGVISVAR